MTDDRLRRVFRGLDAPMEPDARFADRLFVDLAGDLGLVHGGRRGGLGRIRRLAFDRLPAGTSAYRLAYVAALLGLLLAVLAGSLYVASQLRPRPSPLELVQLSQAAYADPPPVRLTIRSPEGEAVVTADGMGTWRSTELHMPPGSFALFDGDRVGRFDATTRAWRVAPLEDSSPPFPLDGPFAWVDLAFVDSKAIVTPVDCSEATDIGAATVAGRAADGVACPGIGMRYWLDRATHLVLRAEADPASPYWAPRDDSSPSVTEVSAFETLDSADESLFAWDGPGATAREPGPVAGTKLVIGEVPAAWAGTTLDGEPFAVPSPGAPAALLMSGTWCPPCLPAYDAFNAVANDHPDVATAIVSLDEPGTLTGYVGRHGASTTIVADPDNGLGGAWGIESIPVLVLIDGQGSVVDVVAGGLAAPDFDRVLAALAVGDPIPAVQPVVPASSPSPDGAGADGADGASPTLGLECTEERVTCLDEGAHPGAWSGPTPGDGTISSTDLNGRPAVLWFESPAMCDGPCPAWVAEHLRGFQALAARYGDRATLLLVTATEKDPGDTERQLQEVGATFPLVFDWDGTISGAYKLAVMGVLVLDSDGRVVEAFGGPYGIHADEVEAALGRLLEP